MKYALTTKVGDLGLAVPATHALEGAGYMRLGQLAGESKHKLRQLHGMGLALSRKSAKHWQYVEWH